MLVLQKQMFKTDCKITWKLHLSYNTADQNIPYRYLLVQSQQWKHQKSVWNLFKVNNIIGYLNFEQISLMFVDFLLTLNK